ncbi:uncharacterized protein Dana_GF15565 [Drosophila ananassae]|uniref:Gustatory receptor n=1 Tax=Drosophila ananassae TaxID=7217 RepID=B3MMB3_DROAN|nr:putative gustatory receptor 39b [Drosophila ananassae]EDV31873.1 uncharacterized protein Dana_GF15565 [Drosophila ananassae]
MLYALQPQLKYFAFLGLVPWSENGQYLQKAYSIFLILFNVGFLGCGIFIENNETIFLSVLVNVVVFVAKIVCSIIVLVQMIVHHNDYYRFCFKMKSIEQRIQSELKISGKRFKCSSIYKIVGLALMSIFGFIPSIYVALRLSLEYFWSSIMSLIIIRGQFVLLMLYIDLMSEIVYILENRIQTVLNCHILSGNCILDGNCKKLCSLEYLLSLKQSYMELHSLFIYFSHLFGWSILSIYVVMFLDSTVDLYWTQQVLAGFYDNTFLYSTCSGFFPAIVLILVFCRLGEQCRKQSLLIGSHVRGLTCNIHNLGEPAYIDLVSEFVMQVEHNALEINVEGFMIIDNSLLMSILAATVTYLIVLMQFSSL